MTDKLPATRNTDGGAGSSRGGVPIPAGIRAIGRYAGSVGRRYSVFNAVEQRVRSIEDRVLRGLGERLHRIRTAPYAPPPEAGGGGVQRTFVVPMHEPPERQLEALLDMAGRQSTDEAREFLYAAMLRELVPDEARLLATLADGQARLTMHAEAGSRFGRDSERAVSHLSDLGQQAGLGLPTMTSYYLEHLMALGLVEEGEPEGDSGKALAALKQLPQAQQAMQAISAAGMQARFVPATVTISALGRELWGHCRKSPPNISA